MVTQEQEKKPNLIITCQADEVWSFSGSKKNKHWIWLVMEEYSRQIIAFHVGERTIKDTKQLWKNIPKIYKKLGYFHTDFLSAYKHIFNKEQHSSCGKKNR